MSGTVTVNRRPVEVPSSTQLDQRFQSLSEKWDRINANQNRPRMRLDSPTASLTSSSSSSASSTSLRLKPIVLSTNSVSSGSRYSGAELVKMGRCTLAISRMRNERSALQQQADALEQEAASALNHLEKKVGYDSGCSVEQQLLAEEMARIDDDEFLLEEHAEHQQLLEKEMSGSPAEDFLLEEHEALYGSNERAFEQIEALIGERDTVLSKIGILNFQIEALVAQKNRISEQADHRSAAKCIKPLELNDKRVGPNVTAQPAPVRSRVPLGSKLINDGLRAMRRDAASRAPAGPNVRTTLTDRTAARGRTIPSVRTTSNVRTTSSVSTRKKRRDISPALTHISYDSAKSGKESLSSISESSAKGVRTRKTLAANVNGQRTVSRAVPASTSSDDRPLSKSEERRQRQERIRKNKADVIKRNREKAQSGSKANAVSRPVSSRKAVAGGKQVRSKSKASPSSGENKENQVAGGTLQKQQLSVSRSKYRSGIAAASPARRTPLPARRPIWRP